MYNIGDEKTHFLCAFWLLQFESHNSLNCLHIISMCPSTLAHVYSGDTLLPMEIEMKMVMRLSGGVFVDAHSTRPKVGDTTIISCPMIIYPLGTFS